MLLYYLLKKIYNIKNHIIKTEILNIRYLYKFNVENHTILLILEIKFLLKLVLLIRSNLNFFKYQILAKLS